MDVRTSGNCDACSQLGPPAETGLLSREASLSSLDDSNQMARIEPLILAESLSACLCGPLCIHATP